jgi:hypothetical protein
MIAWLSRVGRTVLRMNDREVGLIYAIVCAALAIVFWFVITSGVV